MQCAAVLIILVSWQIETPQLRSREKLGLDFDTKMRICIEEAPLSVYAASEKPKTAADASTSAPSNESLDARPGGAAPCEVATPGVRVLKQAAPAAGGPDQESFTLPRGTYITGKPRTSYGCRSAVLHSKRVVEYDLESDDEEVLQGMTGVDEDAFEAAIEALEDKSWSKMWKSVRVPAPPVVPESFHSNSKSEGASAFQTPKCNSRAFSVSPPPCLPLASEFLHHLSSLLAPFHPRPSTILTLELLSVMAGGCRRRRMLRVPGDKG